MNYHLAEWNEYEKKIVEKHKGEKINEKRLYDTYLKKENELKTMLQLNKKKKVEKTEESEHEDSHKILLKRDKKDKNKNTNTLQVNQNPILACGELSTFGLQKSIKNPEKIMQQLL